MIKLIDDKVKNRLEFNAFETQIKGASGVWYTTFGGAGSRGSKIFSVLDNTVHVMEFAPDFYK